MYHLCLLLLLPLAVSLLYSQLQWRLEREIQIAPELNTGPSLQQQSVGGLGTLSHYLPQALFQSTVVSRREECLAFTEHPYESGPLCHTCCYSHYV